MNVLEEINLRLDRIERQLQTLINEELQDALYRAIDWSKVIRTLQSGFETGALMDIPLGYGYRIQAWELSSGSCSLILDTPPGGNNACLSLPGTEVKQMVERQWSYFLELLWDTFQAKVLSETLAKAASAVVLE